MVEILIESGADLNVTAKYNLSALMLAVVGPSHCAISRPGWGRSGREGQRAPGFSRKTAYELALARGIEELNVDLKPR